MEVVRRYSAPTRTAEGWNRIGLTVEGQEDDGEGIFLEAELFRVVGELGLECLVSLRNDVPRGAKLIRSITLRPTRRSSIT